MGASYLSRPTLVSCLAVILAAITSPASAVQFLVGYGNLPYDPLCAESCLRSFTSYMLACPDTLDSGHGSDMSMMSTSAPSCYAASTPFLTSVAWCMSSRCAEHAVAASKLELYWEQTVTGDKAVAPKWSFSTALENVDPKPPAYQMTAADTELNQTSLVLPDAYLRQWNVLGMVDRESIIESTYSIVIFVTAVGLPIALTWACYLPFAETLRDRIAPYIIHPSLIGTYHARPLPLLLGNAPTVGQAIYVIIFTALNAILMSVSYQSAQPSAWFATGETEIAAYVMYRAGVFAFVLLPVLLLFSARNSVLLQPLLCAWPRATFLLLHRWAARLFALHAVLHSVVALRVYYAADVDTAWWAWGAAATVAAVALAVGSGTYVRRRHYELFYAAHVLLAAVVLAGCWFHVVLWYESMGMAIPDTPSYEIWLYFAIAVWGFDWVVRAVRLVKNGVRRATVTDLGAGYVRVDVAGVRWGAEPGVHVYVCFPTLSPLRPWENHPFSVIPTHVLLPSSVSSALSSDSAGEFVESQAGDSWPKDQEKQQQHQEDSAVARVDSASGGSGGANLGTAGITLFIKKSGGMTKHLQSHDGLLTLLDGPYSNSNRGSRGEVLRCDRVLLVAGGIGITGVLAWASHQHWNVKLVWSVAESARCLVDAVDLCRVVVAAKEVRVGRRFDVDELIADEEDAGWARVGVVVSGPGGLCDSVRAAVAAAGRRGRTVFELEVEAYSW
ncbi:ferric reductase-like transmembrane component [Lasiosphaeria ovina]|uniref:Ferric reductase-like transmembrane component n=1 Tax=Lasiosphaeria ovina TaxID=92902 RepID=A0AAE0KMY4_9PEZI|nr:ferric reductase-like transmembrane component [Lasiosphaeria ovina]